MMLSKLEPLGLLSGVDAAAAVAAGMGCWLAGGPVAFTLVRVDGHVYPVWELASAWTAEVERLSVSPPDWAGLGAGPLVMGILNTTPDSFSDGGDHLDPGAAIAAGEHMLAAGVDILDIGGESTRPGAQPTTPEVEQQRVLPVIQALARQGAVLSIDSRNAGTMARALDEGVRIVNDVSALIHDPAALPLVAARGCPMVLMHMRGTPATMMKLTGYDDVANDVARALAVRLAVVQSAGVRLTDVAVDPGFGFAKTARQSIELLRRLPVILGLGCPVMVGASRKAAIGLLGGEVDPKARAAGSLAAALFALSRGARIVRVHDAAETAQAIRVWRGMAG